MKKLVLLSLLVLFGCSKEQNLSIPQIQKFNITIIAGEGGSVPSGGEYSSGAQISITATPNEGYRFINWSNGSNSNPISLEINSTITLTANFELIPTFNITYESVPTEGGTVSGIGTYQEESSINLTAVPNDGYRFVDWSNGSTDETITITLYSDTSITANFESIPPIFLAENGVTIKIEEFANIGDEWEINGNTYKIVNRSILQQMVWNNEDISYVVPDLSGSIYTMFGRFEPVGSISHWDMSKVTNIKYFFASSSFNGDISSWDVSNVTNMLGMFENSQFNGDISSWDVSSVTNMDGMFIRSQFNQDISAWDVSSVNKMYAMFSESPFNQDLSSWDVSSVTNMRYLFYLNSSFNGDISSWDVSSVTNMEGMFRLNSFNGDLSNWDVSSVTQMQSMFQQSQFNGDISNWNVSNVTNMNSMFKMSTFGNNINNWDVSKVSECSNFKIENNNLSTSYIPNFTNCNPD